MAAWLSCSAAGDLQWQGGFPKAGDLQWPSGFPKRREAFTGWQGVSRYALKPGFPIWQPGFPAAPLGIYSGRVALPKRCEAFTGWQGVSRPFRKSRKKVCLGSLASPFGSLAFPQRCRGFTVAKWLSKGAAKHLRGGRVFPVRFGKVEKRYHMRDYMDRRVTPPTWGPPPPCKQSLKGQQHGNSLHQV